MIDKAALVDKELGVFCILSDVLEEVEQVCNQIIGLPHLTTLLYNLARGQNKIKSIKNSNTLVMIRLCIIHFYHYQKASYFYSFKACINIFNEEFPALRLRESLSQPDLKSLVSSLP